MAKTQRPAEAGRCGLERLLDPQEAGHDVSALFTALMMQVMSTPPAQTPDGHAELSALPRSMFTRIMISLTPTDWSLLQSPAHPPGVGVGVGWAAHSVAGGNVPSAKNCALTATSPTVSRCTKANAVTRPAPAALELVPHSSDGQSNGAPVVLTGPRSVPSEPLALCTTDVAVPVTAALVPASAMMPPGGSSAVQNTPSGP